ncbi:polysaccharide deacetylase family protein, partial [Mycobacterium xenopi]|uniref:polysaccharide deacetylase family protein n=1 Tax=Mycobacterium xenopi TaxID=1789 RepID=UPI0022EB1176
HRKCLPGLWTNAASALVLSQFRRHFRCSHADQITGTIHGFRLRRTYGVDGTPYFRPPYGVHNADIDRVAADQGYTTITLWSSTLGDSAPESEASLIANASKAFQPQQIVLAHANLPTITHCYPQLLDLIHSRNLQTVTLNDVAA